MSIILSEIYESTKHKYELSLLGGHKGLHAIMNWVYIAEDIENSDFLRGGELIITTGLSCNNKDWLFSFISMLISHEACGLIINTGKYIQKEDISEDLIELCNKHQFPLFVMPWSVHIADITQDYYDRIFHDTQRVNSITAALKHLLHSNQNMELYMEVLEESHYQSCKSFCVCILDYTTSSINQELFKKKLIFLTDSFLSSHDLHYYFFDYMNRFILICYDEEVSSVKKKASELMKLYHTYYNSIDFYFGIGSVAGKLNELYLSYRRAKAALTMSHYHQEPLYDFDSMGFAKLLLAINDTSLLQKYYHDKLDILLDYDKAHHSEYLETLRQYLLHNGSIQSIAKIMICHRNTVNYRINSIKQLLDYNLDNPIINFEFMVAFCIMDYLNIFPAGN
ncbi:MAG: PucR family transcriptional regulator ligand-binding domain-containing protein [Clostridiaceae bacterium]